tara:strand:+ start:50 stop:454 length:405 start_codon:yes stop_codon:yes gene_type:complete
MANDLNKIMLIGRLGKDAELSTSKGGKQFMKFGMATNYTKRGEEVTTWHNVIVWNEKLVDALHPYLVKGKQIYLEGKFQPWENEKGETIPCIEVSYGHDIQLLGSKSDGSTMNSSPEEKESSPFHDNKDDGVPF